MICNTTNELVCGISRISLTEEEKEILKVVHYWFDGALGITIVCIGMVMNTIATMILRSKEDMKQMMSYLLSVLFIINNVFLLAKFINALVYDFGYKILNVIIPHFVYPVERTCLSAMVFCIICLAHQMYIMIWDPKEYNYISASAASCRKRLAFYIIPCIVLAVAINIPRWLTYELYIEGDDYKIRKSDLFKKFEYVVFYENFFMNIITVFMPMTFLVYFNWSVYNIIRMKQLEIKDKLEYLDNTTTQNNTQLKKRLMSQVQNRDLTNTLIFIIIMFIVCHLPRCFTKFYEGFYVSLELKIFESVQRTLMIIQATATPFIYIRRNKKFWEHVHRFSFL